ncbi:MAG: YggS family pyridoxal phosphate-dependent enzyme [Candidatus Latescibacteria bacterium]|nr:YggS family pyridoxal phosphate-dependent enzyme [bacterium]MBD3424415.1 YggS family pyridoxal phosphate-dependent enzyme [Candidatus Latescibacterota bacterium]
MSLEENLKSVRERISEAAERADRDLSEIRIVAITKTHPPETVDQAVSAGLEDVGENKVQEFLDKSEDVRQACRWHFVGHLQRNKVKNVVGRFQLIHSLDSLRLAREINKRGLREERVTDLLVQVNTSGEDSKYGIAPEEAAGFCEKVSGMEGIRVRGLMTMAPWVDDPGVLRESFSRLRELRDEIRGRDIANISMEHLSMGMSDDFEYAVEEGATILRLGRVLFGPRRK